MVRVAASADHNGIGLKKKGGGWVRRRGRGVERARSGVGGAGGGRRPPLCEAVCREVLAGRADFALVVGGGGSGETIACNKLAGIRAVSCPTVWQTEIARGNNDANVLVVGAKVVDGDLAEQILEAWMRTPFKGAEHARRIEMIAALERGDSLL